MPEHNFKIGDVVAMKAPFNAVFEGTVARIYKQGIKVNFLCGDKVYIPNYMFYTLTNLTKQQNNKEQQMKDQNVKPKNIKPEDEVTITVTYRDLALAYAVLGKTTGPDSMLYKQARSMLDPTWVAYDSLKLRTKTSDQILQYGDYYKEFEALLFPQEPVETEQQKQIRELREQAEVLQEQSKELLQKAKSLEENQK